MNTPLIRVKNGWLDGKLLANGVGVFRGIPFAAPPVGNLRWRPPIAPNEWRGVRKAVAFGPEAVQEADPIRVSPRGDAMIVRSEDCLYLNVWTPAQTPHAALPVFVWIHGGSFTSGAGSHFLYDGAALAEKGVVVVTVNYRLGIFGFLAHSELSAESESNSSGNYGLLDQIQAVRWVGENIAAFGGAPGKITVGGQSAGALSVSALVASPLARGLFRRATMQSGPPFGFSGYYSQRHDAESEGARFMKAAGVKNLAALRAIAAWDLFELSRAFQYKSRITIDGRVLSDNPGNILRAGKHNRADLLLGTTSHEFSAAYSPEKGLSGIEYRAKARSLFGSAADKMMQRYPAGDPAMTASAAIRMEADQLCAAARLAAKLTSNNGNRAYLYYFTRVPPGVNARTRDFYGAAHAAELPYLFRLINKGAVFPWDDRPWGAEDYRYSEILMSYWVNFMKNGDPNGPNLTQWPQYGGADQRILEFGTTIAASQVPRATKLAALESLFGMPGVKKRK